MWLASLPSVRAMRKSGQLGACNPLPFVFIVFNCCAWTTYAVVTRDPFVFLANDPGVLLGLYYLFSAYGLADEAMRNTLLFMTIFFATLLSGVALGTSVVTLDADEIKLAWGIAANFVLLLYYSAPLSTVKTVLVTKSSASLYWPMCMMNVINSTLWVVYGRAVGDMFIWVPNAVGFVLGGLQLLLCIIFPRQPRAPDSPTKNTPLIDEDHLSSDAPQPV
eukprot:jgi/Astpho2/1526/Aster-05400